MKLNLSSQDFHLRKILFKLKNHRSDGLLLQIHHSNPDLGAEKKKYRFIHASFSYNGSHLAVSDHKGNIFIINLEMEWVWQLPQVGLPTIISFPPLKNHELLAGLDSSSILLIHTETGNVTGILQGHTVPATEISYSDDGYYYLTSCSTEAIVWDSSTCAQIHRLSLNLEVLLKKVVFMPATNHILACFEDDTMHIWKFSTFECIKQIVPESWKTHHLRAIAITRNGRAMVVGGHSPALVIFCLDTWAIRSVVEFPKSVCGVKQLEFLSQVFDGGANKILTVLTMSQELIFLDIETLNFFKWMHEGNTLTAKFSLSSNGKYMAMILTSGEVNVYTIEKLLSRKNLSKNAKEKHPLNKNPSGRNHSRSSNSSKRTQKSNESLTSIQKEIKTALGVKRLLPILKQFGEYPQSYRSLIWKILLKLPENKNSFVSLSLKKCHPSYSKLELKYPLVNKSLGNALKRLLSNISHWCPLFGEVDFLPEFAFPFVKLLHSSPLLCFEVVATVIVNWCQNWFEFYPFPPINMLSMLESVLGYHDPSLLQFYMMNDITSSVTVCPLFHTAFSEVLSKTEWLKLWDHVLSNEPSFLFMAIIAYNVVCQNAIRTLEGVVEIEVLSKPVTDWLISKFFHTQKPVDMKAVIRKAYHYLKETPEHLHTRQFFAPFRSLGACGTYISFIAYPRLIVDAGVEKLQSIRQEEEKILNEQLQASTTRKALEKKLQPDSTFSDKENLYRELEEKMRQTVENEEDRLLAERWKLQNLRQELKLKELQVLELTRNKALDEKIKRKELQFERLIQDISKRRSREKAEVDAVEEIKNYYFNLFLRKCQLESELEFLSVCDVHNLEEDAHKSLDKMQEDLKRDLTALQYERDNLHYSRRIDLCNKITAIKDLISNVELELAKETVDKTGKDFTNDEKTVVRELKKKVKLLENEVEFLIRENLHKLRKEKEQQRTNLDPPRKSKNENSTLECKVKNTETTKSPTAVNSISKNCWLSRPSSFSKTTVLTRVPGVKAEPLHERRSDKQFSTGSRSDIVKKLVMANSEREMQGNVGVMSKFTRASDPQGSSQGSHEECSLPKKNWQEDDVMFMSNNAERKKITPPLRRDRSHGGKLFEVQTYFKNKKKGKVSKFTIKRDSSLSGSEEEIFKSALRARNNIVEEAKRHQMFQHNSPK